MADVTDIDPDEQLVHLADGEQIRYDSLVVAAGFRYHYFGNEQWREHALDLQGVDKALDIREQILSAYEEAPNRNQIRTATGVADIRRRRRRADGRGTWPAASPSWRATRLKNNFRRIDPTQSRVLLLEATDRVLPAFPKKLSGKALRALDKLGVSVRLNTLVKDVAADHVLVERERRDRAHRHGDGAVGGGRQGVAAERGVAAHAPVSSWTEAAASRWPTTSACPAIPTST